MKSILPFPLHLKKSFTFAILLISIGIKAQTNQHINIIGTDIYMIIKDLYYINAPQINYIFPEIDAEIQYKELKHSDERSGFLDMLDSISIKSDSISLNGIKYLEYLLDPKNPESVVKAILIDQGEKLGVLTLIYNQSSKGKMDTMIRSIIINPDANSSDYYEFKMNKVGGFSNVEKSGSSVIQISKNGSVEMGSPSILISTATIQTPEIIERMKKIKSEGGIGIERYEEVNKEVIFFTPDQMDEDVFLGEFLVLGEKLCLSGAYIYNTEQEQIDIKNGIKSIKKK